MLMPAIFDGDLFDDLFDDLFAPDRAARPLKPMERIGFPVNGLMKTDVKETENGYELDMDLPGYITIFRTRKPPPSERTSLVPQGRYTFGFTSK